MSLVYKGVQFFYDAKSSQFFFVKNIFKKNVLAIDYECQNVIFAKEFFL